MWWVTHINISLTIKNKRADILCHSSDSDHGNSLLEYVVCIMNSSTYQTLDLNFAFVVRLIFTFTRLVFRWLNYVAEVVEPGVQWVCFEICCNFGAEDNCTQNYLLPTSLNQYKKQMEWNLFTFYTKGK